MNDLPKTDFAFIDSITNVNYKPHPPMVGTRAVAYASDKCNGMLTEEAFDRSGGCEWQDHRGAPKCGRKMRDHKSDKVAFVKLTRNATKAEMQAWLNELISPEGQQNSFVKENKLDGFAFVKTEFDFVAEEEN